MAVMKMGNIVPRVGIEPTSFAFRDSVLTITPSRVPDVNIRPTPTCLCDFLRKKLITTTLYVYIYIYIYICCVSNYTSKLSQKPPSASHTGQLPSAPSHQLLICCSSASPVVVSPWPPLRAPPTSPYLNCSYTSHCTVKNINIYPLIFICIYRFVTGPNCRISKTTYWLSD